MIRLNDLRGIPRHGVCPECANPTAAIYPDRWRCTHCGGEGPIPQAT